MHFLRSAIFAVLAAFCCAFSGDEPAPLRLQVRHNAFGGDNIGNIYTVNEDELVKYLPSGKFFARYSNLRLGSITTLDATNPLKLLLYYHDFQQIVFLDNQLSQNSAPVSLEALGYEQTWLACAGANNSFWIYNKQNNELIRFDENSKKTASTGNLKQVLNTNLEPDFMREYNGYLFLNCPASGIYVFDIFGAFSKVIALKGLNAFQLTEDILYYQRDSVLCSYNHKLFEESCKRLPLGPKGVRTAYYNKQLLLSSGDTLLLYPF